MSERSYWINAALAQMCFVGCMLILTIFSPIPWMAVLIVPLLMTSAYHAGKHNEQRRQAQWQRMRANAVNYSNFDPQPYLDRGNMRNKPDSIRDRDN